MASHRRPQLSAAWTGLGVTVSAAHRPALCLHSCRHFSKFFPSYYFMCL